MTTAHEQLKEQYEQSLESQEGFYLSAKAVEALLTEHRALLGWRTDFDNVPKDGTPVILANFDAECLLSGAPHVWTARYVTADSWTDGDGNPVPPEKGSEGWLECSYAAMNENGHPTHWMPLPTPPSPEAGNE